MSRHYSIRRHQTGGRWVNVFQDEASAPGDVTHAGYDRNAPLSAAEDDVGKYHTDGHATKSGAAECGSRYMDDHAAEFGSGEGDARMSRGGAGSGRAVWVIFAAAALAGALLALG